MVKTFFKNCSKPEGMFGSILLEGMNKGHEPFGRWIFDNFPFEDNSKILDVGCGGGANILKMFELYPNAYIDGVDYSEVSVKKSKSKLKKYLNTRCNISQGDVMSLPYSDAEYNAVIALDTIYFWTDIAQGSKEIYRVLKPKGKFVIGCELHDPKKSEMYTKHSTDMIVYTTEQLEKLLIETGFSDIEIHEKGEWLGISGTKKS